MQSGYILHSDNDRVVIATLTSDNTKTGNMIQVWILRSDMSPVEAVKSGSDSLICGNCPHRGRGFRDRSCYVNVGQGPRSVYQAYRNGRYPYLPLCDYASVFTGRSVRFGAYGDPCHIPLGIVRWIVFYADKVTGYTHQWTDRGYSAYREHLMASADSESEYRQAKQAGWRVFRVREAGAPLLAGEIMCPASDESGRRTQCDRCGLCNGCKTNHDRRKDIAIVVHGAGRRKFVQITP